MKILSRPPLRQFLRSGVVFAAVTLASGAIPTYAVSGAGGEADGDSTETSVYTYNLPGNVTDCVSLYPKPNCGIEPHLSGDRGGVMQYATFGAIIAGLGIIMTVIARSVMRTDRAKTRQAESDLQKPSRLKVNN